MQTQRRLPLALPLCFSLLAGALAGCADEDAVGAFDGGMDDGDTGEDAGDGDGDSGDGDGDGDGSGSGDGDGDGDDGNADDTTAPELSGVSPEDGQNGIMEDAVIVFSFSEPMDQASAEAAWYSDDIPEVAFSWNEAGDEMTVTPSAPLEYAVVVDANQPARAYGFGLEATATDLAGNPLESATEVEFETMRGQLLAAFPHPTLSGAVSSSGPTLAYSQQNLTYVGDAGAQDWIRTVLTFDFALPAQTEFVAAAQISAQQKTDSGVPYFDLGGEIDIAQVEYDALGVAACEADAMQEMGAITDGPMPAEIAYDVTQLVSDAHDDQDTRLQFRLQFPIDNDGQNDDDYQRIDQVALLVMVAYP